MTHSLPLLAFAWTDKSARAPAAGLLSSTCARVVSVSWLFCSSRTRHGWHMPGPEQTRLPGPGRPEPPASRLAWTWTRGSQSLNRTGRPRRGSRGRRETERRRGALTASDAASAPSAGCAEQGRELGGCAPTQVARGSGCDLATCSGRPCVEKGWMGADSSRLR